MAQLDMNDAEIKAAVKELIDAAVTEATEGLKAKNSELLGKIKKLQKDSAIDPAEYSALQTELEQTKEKLAEATKQLKAVTSDSEKTKKALESEKAAVEKLIVDNGLNDAILKAGVKPEMSKAVKALLASQVVLKADGDTRTAVIGDKPLNDAVLEWAKSDEGKHFVAAAASSGTGATGGKPGADGAKVMMRAEFDKLDPAKRMEFVKGGGELRE